MRDVLFEIVNRLTRLQKRLVFLAVDVTLAPLTAAMVFHAHSAEIPLQAWLFLPGLLFIAAATSSFYGLPQIKLIAYELRAILTTVKFAAVTTLGLVGLCHAIRVPCNPSTMVAFLLTLLCLTVGSRFFMLAALRWVLENGKTRRRAFIYGAGQTGLHAAAALRGHPNIQVIGFLDDNPDLQAMTVGGLPVLSPSRLSSILQKQHADLVLLAMPSVFGGKQLRLSHHLRTMGLEVQTVPSLAHLGTVAVLEKLVPPVDPNAFLGRTTLGDALPDLGHEYKGKVVLISGAGGSVGAELCRQILTYQPRKLVLFERSELALYAIEGELCNLAHDCGVEIVSVLGSVTDDLQARTTMIDHQVDVIFHTAAYKHVSLVETNPVAGLANNVLGTRIFCDAAIAARVGRFVLISTDKAVRPTSVMGATKRLAEIVVQDIARRSVDTQFSIVRFGNVLGSSGSVLPRFRDQIAKGGPITLTDNNVTRYFMTIAEASRLVLIAGALWVKDAPKQASVFVLDMGQPVRIRDLAERMIRAEGLCPRTADNPDGDIEIILTGLRAGEKLHEELFIGQNYLPTPHPKILRAQESCLSEFAVASVLKSVRRTISSGDQASVRAIFVEWIDGYPAAPLPVRAKPALNTA